MRKKTIATAMILASLSMPALAAPVLDQSYLPSGDLGTVGLNPAPFEPQSLAQTFTVGLSGQLTGVALALSDKGTNGANFQILVAKVSGGVPATTPSGFFVKASGVNPSHTDVPDTILSTYSLADLFFVDLTGISIQVTAGEQLAIVVKTDSSIEWAAKFKDTYSGGDPSGANPNFGTPAFEFFGTPADFLFATYVDPGDIVGVTSAPEPWSLALFGTCIAGFAYSRRRRNTRHS